MVRRRGIILVVDGGRRQCSCRSGVRRSRRRAALALTAQFAVPRGGASRRRRLQHPTPHSRTDQITVVVVVARAAVAHLTALRPHHQLGAVGTTRRRRRTQSDARGGRVRRDYGQIELDVTDSHVTTQRFIVTENNRPSAERYSSHAHGDDRSMLTSREYFEIELDAAGARVRDWPGGGGSDCRRVEETLVCLVRDDQLLGVGSIAVNATSTSSAAALGLDQLLTLRRSDQRHSKYQQQQQSDGTQRPTDDHTVRQRVPAGVLHCCKTITLHCHSLGGSNTLRTTVLYTVSQKNCASVIFLITP